MNMQSLIWLKSIFLERFRSSSIECPRDITSVTPLPTLNLKSVDHSILYFKTRISKACHPLLLEDKVSPSLSFSESCTLHGPQVDMMMSSSFLLSRPGFCEKPRDQSPNSRDTSRWQKQQLVSQFLFTWNTGISHLSFFLPHITFLSFFFKIGSHYIALTGLELTRQTKLALNSEKSAPLCLPSTDGKACTTTPGPNFFF